MIVLLTTDATAALVNGPAVPIDLTALTGALLLLLLTPRRSSLLERVDGSILLLFAGLFVVVGGATTGGVIAHLDGLFPIPSPGEGTGAVFSISATSLLGPRVVSNVPWVALQIPIMTGRGYNASTPIPWLALAAASTLAGNLTPLGAASNLIVVQQAQALGVRIRLTEFCRQGIPITVLVLVLSLWAGI